MKGKQTMKTLIKNILVLMILAFQFTKIAKAQVDDDIYYSPKNDTQMVSQNNEKQNDLINEDEKNDPEKQSSNNKNTSPRYSETEEYVDENGNSYITNNYYGDDYYSDDYYDYAYASRIRRFYGGCSSFGYYNDYYTNLYWYDYNPISWGISIYLGYNWWYPYFSYRPYYWYPSVYFSYPSVYSYYGGYYGCSSFSYYGYPYYGNSCYYNTYPNYYYDNYNYSASNNYYNSYDNNSTYYGNRGSSSSNSDRKAPRTLGEIYEEGNLARNKNLTKDGIIAVPVQYTEDIKSVPKNSIKSIEYSEGKKEISTKNMETSKTNAHVNKKYSLDDNKINNVSKPNNIFNEKSVSKEIEKAEETRIAEHFKKNDKLYEIDSDKYNRQDADDVEFFYKSKDKEQEIETPSKSYEFQNIFDSEIYKNRNDNNYQTPKKIESESREINEHPKNNSTPEYENRSYNRNDYSQSSKSNEKSTYQPKSYNDNHNQRNYSHENKSYSSGRTESIQQQRSFSVPKSNSSGNNSGGSSRSINSGSAKSGRNR